MQLHTGWRLFSTALTMLGSYAEYIIVGSCSYVLCFYHGSLYLA